MLEPDLPLLRILADGRFHSGRSLAMRFGVSRSTIWKQVRNLGHYPGLEVQAVSGRGYRLPGGLELLQESRIRKHLENAVDDDLQHLEILSVTRSSNDYLRSVDMTVAHGGAACLAEYQLAGRGRRGRCWASAYGRNIILSLSWRFDLPLAGLSGLSIAVGCAFAEVLDAAGLSDISLKWPNDLQVAGRKLGGILVEATGELDGPSRAVIGLGLNLSSKGMPALDQPWTTLEDELATGVSRNRLAGSLLNALVRACRRYGESGLGSFLPRWEKYDACRGRLVELQTASGSRTGQYLGIDPGGGLILAGTEGHSVHFAGEVSLRVRP